MKNKTQYGATITGIGSSVPEKILSNSDLEKMVDTSDEWIVKRTGMKERRVLKKDEPAYVLAIDAARKALKLSNIDKSEIDLIICSTSTPDYLSPSISSIVQRELGIKNSACFDMNAACSGFPYGITVAKQFINTGTYKNVIVIACEALSKAVDWEDRNTCVLFGDGAGAVVLSRSEEENIIATDLGCVGELGDNITIPCFYSSKNDMEKRINDNPNVIWMDGGEVFKFAVKKLAKATKNVLKKAKMKVEDISLLVPHQANIRIIENSSKRLKLSPDKVMVNLEKYGNTSSASVPIALDEAYRTNRIKKDDIVILVGFGAGLTWGANLIKWSI